MRIAIHRMAIAAVCVMAAAMLGAACSRHRPPDSLFDAAGYHVTGDTICHLNSFPGTAFPIAGADAATFEVLNETYARDKTTVYVNGSPIPGVDPASFPLLDRPNLGKDHHHVYLLDRTISDDPAHFELLEASLSKDGHAVYGSTAECCPRILRISPSSPTPRRTCSPRTVDGSRSTAPRSPGRTPRTFHLLSGAYGLDGQHVFYFADMIAEADSGSLHALEGPYARDSRHAYWMGKPIAGADPSTFAVLNADFECSADQVHAYYRQSVIASADPRTFPAGRPVTTCSADSISFAN